MTRKATKTSKPAVSEHKRTKLALSKKTVKDLTPRSRGAAVRAGINKTNTCGCF